MVMAYPYSPCTQINTFAVVDSIADLETSNLGATYQDYLDGSFWSRKWVMQGADPDTLCKEYPMLVLEQKKGRKKDILESTTCLDWWLVFMDVPDCGDCKDECKRSIAKVDSDLRDMVEVILKEVKRFALYSITDGESNVSQVWATDDQIQHWFATGAIIDYTNDCGDILPFLDCGIPVDICAADVGNVDQARAISIMIRACDCHDIETEFDYTLEVPKGIARTKCEGC